MESIIKKAIEGRYVIKDMILKDGQLFAFRKMESLSELFGKCILDPLFWQSLGKACGWGNKRTYNQADQLEVESYWKIYALRFHEINLTESWDKAVEYLSELIK